MNTATTKSNTGIRALISKYSNPLRKHTNLSGSLRKSMGMKMLRKIKAARKSDW